MKKIIYLLPVLLSISLVSRAQQTTAMDFNRPDCNGVLHHLFGTLDSNEVVILEFLMLNCSPCIEAADEMEPMIQSIQANNPGRLSIYNIGFDDSYICGDLASWVNTHNPTAFPMDSGGAMLAYYGGFGMPTIIIVGGSNHDVLYTGIGYSTSDTTMMGSAIRNYFLANPTGISDVKNDFTANVFPNPSNDLVNVALTLNNAADVSLQIIDLTGRVTMDSYYNKVEAGAFTASFNTASLASGLYLIRATVNGESSQQKINVVR